MISSWRRTRRWLSPYPPGRSQIASLSLRIQVKWRGVMPSAHLPRSLGGISAAFRCRCRLEPHCGSRCYWPRIDDPEPLAAAFDPASVGQLAGDRLAAGDRQHALDAGRVGRIAVDGEPAPQRPAGERRRCGGDGDARRWGRRRRRARRAARSSSRSRSAVRARIGVTSRPAISAASGSSSWRTRLRHIAGEAFDAVADGHDPELGAHRLGLAAAQGQDRVARSGLDRRQPVAAAAAQQAQQHGLGLVVGGVAGHRLRPAAPLGGRPGRRASRFGPGATSTVWRTNSTPSVAAIRSAASASAPIRAAARGRRGGRRRRARARTASATRAVESGRPRRRRRPVVRAAGTCSARAARRAAPMAGDSSRPPATSPVRALARGALTARVALVR